MQILGAFDIQLERPRKRVKDLGGRMLVAALLESQVVVGADARQYRQLLAAQTRNASARTRYQPDMFGTNLFAPRTKVFTEGVAFHRHHMSLKLSLPIPGLVRLPLLIGCAPMVDRSSQVQRQDIEFTVRKVM